jgi:hypothetical protein
MARNWECGVVIDDAREVEEVSQLLLLGFGARSQLHEWAADDIASLRDPVRVLRSQIPPTQRRPRQEPIKTPAIRLRRKAEKALVDSFAGWTRLVLTGVLSFKSPSFTLDQLVTACQPLVDIQFPLNRFVRPQIRKQLQRLRDLGLVQFEGGGQYLRNIN